MSKKCFKCGAVKSVGSFYEHKAMKDGRLGKCIDCTKKDVEEHRLKNIDRIRKYDRRRSKLPHRKIMSAKICKTYRKEYPLRYAASTLLKSAIQSGKIKRPKRCSICKAKTRIMGHHNDYCKPLVVIWVCQICHKGLHSKKIAI